MGRYLTYMVFLTLYSQMFCEDFTLKKCCASSDRYNKEIRKCVPNKNFFEFKINLMVLDKNGTLWDAKVQDFSARYKQRQDLCDGVEKDDPNYKLIQNGSLVHYTGPDQNYYNFYNNFCLDVDHSTGKPIAIICNNKRTVPKCCDKTQKLVKSAKRSYRCEATNEAILLNDLADVLWKSEEIKPNIGYRIRNYLEIKNIEIAKNYSLDHFEFDENRTMTKFRNNTNFCLDKFEDSWIVLTGIDLTTYNLYIATFSTISLVAIVVAVFINRILWFKIENYLLWIYTICLFTALLIEAISAFAEIKLELSRDLLFAESFCIIPLILFLKFFEELKMTKFFFLYFTVVILMLVISMIFITLSHNLEDFIGELLYIIFFVVF
jgi:hypothetical protein